MSSFSELAYLDARPTDDRTALAQAFEQIAGGPPQGGTALYDAVAAACRLPNIPNFHRVLVVLTDGEDNASRQTREKALDVARGTGTALYFIGHGAETGQRESPEANRARAAMKEMASATGGMYFRASGKPDAESAFDSLAHIVRAQYALDFQPSLLPKKKQPIMVRCSRKGVQITAPDSWVR